MSIIESELTLFEMEEKQIFPDAASFREPRLGSTPEAFNAVDMDSPPLDRENIVAVIDPVVFAVAKVDEAVVASPAIGVDDAAAVHLPSDNGLQRAFFGVGNNFGVHFPIALEDAKDDSLRPCATSTLPLDALRPEVRLIHFNDTTEPSFLFTSLCDSSAKRHEVPIDRVAVESRDAGHFRRLKVEGKKPNDVPELTL